jgi:hypothetical protein
MLILLLLVVVVAAVAVAAAAGAAASGREGADRSLLGGAGPPLILLGGIAAVVVLGAVVAVTVGFRGGGGADEEAATAPPSTSVPTEPRAAPVSPDEEPDLPQAPSATGPEVTVRAGGAPTVIDRIPGSTVLVVNAAGFEPGTGEVAQCGLDAAGPSECRNAFPVEFGAEGTARFQYFVTDRVHDGERCGAGERPCLVVVSGPEGTSQGRAFTVFRGPAPPPGTVSAGPRGPLSDGDLVTLTATGFPPAIRLLVAQCPAEIDLRAGDCRPAESARTGPDGAAVLHLRVHAGEADGVVCGPRQPCSIRVTADAPVAPVILPVTFSAGPSARYDGLRLAGGLVLAALLLALGWYVLRTTDWREPAAAATPEMDRAALDA